MLIRTLVVAAFCFTTIHYSCGAKGLLVPTSTVGSGMKTHRLFQRLLNNHRNRLTPPASAALGRSASTRYSFARRPPPPPPRLAGRGTVRFAATVPVVEESATADSLDGLPDFLQKNATMTEYEFWVRRLYATNMFHPVKMGLQNIEQLHGAMGRPMDELVVVHIAGTNGKGSVALKIAKSLELSNPRNKIGLFCSPHVSSFRERMQVNGELITEEEVVEYLPYIYQLCKEYDVPATYFEITTALAFHYFSRRQCDVVVLETGLGGRLDATNVIKAPALSVITSIGLEHTRILGDTIEQIALEKGGIIKPYRPVLVGPNVPMDVLRQCATEKGASAFYTTDDVLGRQDVPEQSFVDYDSENIRIATAALQLLKQDSTLNDLAEPLTDDVIRRGTSHRPPCRFEHVQLENGVEVILDVAHNPPAMDYMVRKLQASYPHAKFRVVVGMSSDKDLSLCGTSILQAVNGDASRIHLAEAANPRAAKLEAILEATKLQDKAHYDLEDRSVTTQIEQAMELAVKNEDVLVICGSVFLMSEAREALGFDEPRDSPVIAELAGAGVRHSQEVYGNSTFVDTKLSN